MTLLPVFKNLHVLLVEDTYFNQLLAIEFLTSKIDNVQIDIAENGQIALDRIAEASYDFILMDVKMPVMDGLETTRNIRNHADFVTRKLPIVGLTANALPEELEECRIAGMDRWVTKPINEDELMQAISAVLNGSANELAL